MIGPQRTNGGTISGPHDEINLKILDKDDEPRVCSPEEYEADFDSSRHGAGDVAIQPFTLPKDGGEELIGAGRLELVGPFDWNVGRTMEPPRNRDIAASGRGVVHLPSGAKVVVDVVAFVPVAAKDD